MTCTVIIVLDYAQDPLVAGWEERKDRAGRTYYVNHETRTTQVKLCKRLPVL